MKLALFDPKMGISRRQRRSRYELTHGMSGLFRKVSRWAKIIGLCGWAGRIRTSKCPFLDVRDKVFESTREFLTGLERLRSRDFAAFCARTARFRTPQRLGTEPGLLCFKAGAYRSSRTGQSSSRSGAKGPV